MELEKIVLEEDEYIKPMYIICNDSYVISLDIEEGKYYYVRFSEFGTYVISSEPTEFYHILLRKEGHKITIFLARKMDLKVIEYNKKYKYYRVSEILHY